MGRVPYRSAIYGVQWDIPDNCELPSRAGVRYVSEARSRMSDKGTKDFSGGVRHGQADDVRAPSGGAVRRTRPAGPRSDAHENVRTVALPKHVENGPVTGAGESLVLRPMLPQQVGDFGCPPAITDLGRPRYSPNQRARRLDPKRSFSPTRATEGSIKLPVGEGPERKSTSTRPTRPPPYST
jgi:hypothetical protein